MEAMSGLDDADEGRGRLEETKRVARLVELATLLASQPGRWPRARLAERFEIGERQLARDLEILRHGMHYQIERTPGGYVIQGAPPLPPLVVTMPEALALALAAGLARDTGDVDAGTLGAVLAKLEALLPPDALGLLRRDLLRGATQRRSEARRATILALVEQAWLERRRLHIVYETGSRDWARSERTVEPYHIQRHYGRFWILTAYDHRRGQVRDFKLSRIRQAELLNERYTIPDDFDIVAHRGAVWGVLTDTSAPVEVRLLLSARAGHWIAEEDWSAPLTVEPQPDGRVQVCLHTTITAELLRWILWHGPDCLVLAPDALREQVRQMAAETAKLYKPSP